LEVEKSLKSEWAGKTMTSNAFAIIKISADRCVEKRSKARIISARPPGRSFFKEWKPAIFFKLKVKEWTL